MTRLTRAVSRARSVLQDFDLLKALRSEINHELASNRFQSEEAGSLVDFVVEWDSPRSQDVVFRKRCNSGEEVAVSALLGHEISEEVGKYPREVLMKVCIKKPGLGSILQFDCGVSEKGVKDSYFEIHSASFLSSLSTASDSSTYRGPKFSSLDPQFQEQLKQYLVTRGIGESFTNYLLFHLHKKEQNQYVNWLHELEAAVSEIE